MKENAKPTKPTVQNTGHLIYPYEYTQKESYASGRNAEEIPASGQMREPGKRVAEKQAGEDIFSESFNDMQALSKASSLPYMEKAGLWDKFDKTAETRRQIREEQDNKKAQRDISLLTSPRYSKFTAFLLGGAGDHTVFLDNKGREYFVPTAKVGRFMAEYPGVKQVDDSGKYTDEVLDNMYTQYMEEEYLAGKPENADRLRKLYKGFTPDMGRKERFSAIDKLYREVFDEDLATSIEKQISDTNNRITAYRKQFEDEYVEKLVEGKTTPLVRFTGAYKPKLLRNLNHAQDLINKINQELRARKNQTGFWKGLADADWSQLLTGDVQTLYDAITERNLFARIDNYGIDVLDDGEKLLLDALVAGEALRSYPKETTTAHNIGNIVANSAGWIGPFAGSKFLLKGIVAAGKKGAKALARRALGKYIAARAKETGAAVAAEAATETVKKGIKQKAKEWVKEKGTDAVVEMGGSAGQLALMPTFYADLANTYNGEIQLKDSGSGENRTFEYAGRKISDTPFRDSFLRNFVTVHVEKLGINIPIFKNIGKAIPGNSRFWRGVRVAVTGTGGEAMKRAINFDGFVGEYVEEMIDGTLNALLVGDQTLEDVYSAKNQIETAFAVGVMTFGMGLVSGGLSIPASRKVKKNLINAEEELKEMIPSVEDRQAFIKRVADSDYAGQAEILMEFADKEKSAEARGDFKMKAVYREAARIAANYINSFNRLAAYDSYAAEEIKERLDAERKAIKSASNPDMGGNIIVAAYNGKNVRVVAGNIEFNEDGSVNAAKSSESVVILNDDGTRQQISPQGLRLSEILDSALLESDAADRITEEVRSEAMATIDSENNREYLTDEQAEYLLEMGIKGVELDEATDAYYVESPELSEVIEEARVRYPGTPDINRQQGQTVQTSETEPPRETEQAQRQYPTDAKGNPDFTQITPEQAAQILTAEYPEDYEVFVNNKVAAAEKRTKKAGKAKPQSTDLADIKAERDAIRAEQTAAQQEYDYWNNVKTLLNRQDVNNTTEQTAEEQSADANLSVAENETLQPGQTVEETTAAKQEQQLYPVDESGEPLWYEMTGEQFVVAMAELGDTADAFIADKIKEAQKATEKAEKSKPKSTEFAKRKAEQQAITAEKAAAQKAYDFWMAQQARRAGNAQSENLEETNKRPTFTEKETSYERKELVGDDNRGVGEGEQRDDVQTDAGAAGMDERVSQGDSEMLRRKVDGNNGEVSISKPEVLGTPGLESKYSNTGRISRIGLDVKIEKTDQQISELLTNKGTKHTSQKVRLSTPQEFHAAISKAKKSNPNGWMVDVHSVDEYADCTLLITDDGLSGVAVTPTGDIVSLFSAVSKDSRMQKLIPMAVALGGNKLDCYVVDGDKNLADMYSWFGFKPANKIPFNPQYAPEDFVAWAEEHPNKVPLYVATMYYVGEPQETITNYNADAEADLDAVPTIEDYDAAMQERDALLALELSKVNAANTPEADTSQPTSAEHTTETPAESSNLSENEVQNAASPLGEDSNLSKNKADSTKKLLNEAEYINLRLNDSFENRKDKTLSRKDWENTDEYIEIYNNVADEYPAYIANLGKSGELQNMFDKGTVSERIKIQNAIETAGYSVPDFIDRENVNKEAREKREARRKEKMRETMNTLGIDPDTGKLKQPADTEERYRESEEPVSRQKQTGIPYRLSEELDENGHPFVLASDGTTTFGEIRADSGLQPAPIKLSRGIQDENGKGYGLLHIEANHGEEIRKAGFSSVNDFVSFIAHNYDKDNIRVGKRRHNGNITYLLQVTDSHDNTLFIEMSRDGSYWNVNSAGVFRKKYSNKKETVVKTEPQQPNNAISAGSSLSENEESGITSSEPNGEPPVSNSKYSKKSSNGQEPSGGRIEDYGEQIAGARKDILRDIARTLENTTLRSLISLPFSKAFKRPDLKKALESGALREKDVYFAEAVMAATLSLKKPKAGTRKDRIKKLETGKTGVESWAEEAFSGIQILKELFNAEETERDAIIKRTLSVRTYGEEQVKAYQQKLEQWNPGKTFNGTAYPINQIALFYEVLRQINLGDRYDISFPVVAAIPNTANDYYYLITPNGEKLYYLQKAKTFDNVVSQITYLTKLYNDIEVSEHPRETFDYIGREPIYISDGWLVFESPDARKSTLKILRFDTKEEAEAYREKITKENNKADVSEPVEDKTHNGYYKRYEAVFTNPITGEHLELGIEYDSKESAEESFKDDYQKLNEAANEAIAQKNAETKDNKKGLLEIIKYYDYENKKFKYGIIISDSASKNNPFDTMPLYFAEGIETKEEALSLLEKNKDDWEKKAKEVKERRQRFVYFAGNINTRIGEDYRQGKNVSAEEFATKFGFRGVQFGNWTNQEDRQAALNNSYDSFMDLSRILNVSPRALSLNGELGIAFGSRGSGKANAHYETKEVVINLTKTRGVGALAHEWWHALDNYFARQFDVPAGFATANKKIKLRSAMREAFNAIVDNIKKSDYHSRSRKRGTYWGSIEEETARVFEEWVAKQLSQHNAYNHFLTEGTGDAQERYARMQYEIYQLFDSEFNLHKGKEQKELMTYEEFKKTPQALRGFVYPTKEELETFGKDLENLFDVIQERVDEETGNIALYRSRDIIDMTEEELAEIRAKEREKIDRIFGKEYLDNVAKAVEKRKAERKAVVSKAARELRAELAASPDIVLVSDLKDIPEEDLQGKTPQEAIRRMRAKGWYTPGNGKVYINLSMHSTAEDVKATILHEAVAHKGLRALLGEESFGALCDAVYRSMPKKRQKAYEDTYKKIYPNTAEAELRRIIADEYMARLAEGGVRQSIPQRIISAIREFLRSIGIDLDINDADIRHLLAQSYKNMQEADAVTVLDNSALLARLRKAAEETHIKSEAESLYRIDYSAEKQDIITRAQANGTYMKAPNGKPTNLTERQWVQVRTKAFKEWFGDWEKAARIEKLRASKPVEITGDEYKGKYEMERESAKQWMKANLRGEYVIADTGERIEVSGTGVDKVTSHSMGNEAHLKSLAVMPQLIENAIFIDELPNEKGNGKYDSYRYYVCGLKIGGVDYTVKVTIGVKQGKRYYDHSLTEIEKGNLYEIANGFTTTGGAPVPSSAEYKDRRLVSILQTNSSKVVDENGEPNADVAAFYPTQIKSATDNTGTFSSENADIRFREDNDLEAVNRRFNEELERYQQGKMSKNEMFHLGLPNGVMSIFLPNLPIVMRQKVVNKAAKKKHDVEVSSIMNMPQKISEPILVFKKDDKSLSILSEMKDRVGRNVFVALDLSSEIQDGKRYIEVNNVTTIHGRRMENIIRPINENNSLQWVDKKKALEWFSSASPNVQQEITSQELKDATNKIKTFENPNFETEKNTKDIRFRLDPPEEQQVRVASEASDRTYTETDKAPEIDYDMPAGDVAEQVSAKAAIEPLYRLDVFDKDFASEIAIQEAMQRTKMYRENEQWRRATKKLWTGIYDSMSPLAAFISMVEERTGRIMDENNPYWLENAAMSKAQERSENLRREYVIPFAKSIKKAAGKVGGRERLKLYGIGKAALERQAVKAAEPENADVEFRDFGGLTGLQRMIIVMEARGNLSDAELDLINRADYEGLVKYAKSKKYSTLEQYVEKCDKLLGKDGDTLWDAARKLSRQQLKGQYEAGLIGRDAYYYLISSERIGDMLEANCKNGIISDKRYRTLLTNEMTVDEMHDGGYITDEQYTRLTTYNPLYKYYLPLKGDADITASDIVEYDKKERKNLSRIRKVKGHEHLVRDPFTQLVSDCYGAIVNEENNRWLRALLDIVRTTNLGEGVVKVTPAYTGRGRARNSVLIADVKAAAAEADEHTVIAYDGGRAYQMTFTDLALAHALRTDGGRFCEVSGIVKWANKLTRMWASTMTTLSPTFLLANPVRDVQDGLFVNFTNLGARAIQPFLRGVNPGGQLQKALHRYLKGDKSGNSEYDALVREYFANGGPVAYTMLADYQSIKSDLDTLAGDEKNAKKVARTVIDWMAVHAKHSELLSRIATYALYRGTIPDLSIGIQASVTEAIWQSKEVTVNFDKRGEWSRYAGVAELFFNAGRQSNRNHLNLIRNHPVRYLAASAVMGAIKATIQGLLATVSSMLFGGHDEQEDAQREYLDKYFSINRFTRYSNLCLVLGDKIVKIPISPSFMPLSIMAEIAAEMMYTDFTKERALTMTADLAVAAAQLVGGECLGAVVGAIAHDSPAELTKAIPFALMQPVLELAANRNWLGNKIMRDDKWVEGLAAHTRAYSNVEDYYMTVAQAINRLGGGDDEGEPGRLNNLLANPAAYKHLIESYLGGIGSFVFDSFSTASLLAQGKYDRALQESPAKRFFADADAYREQEAWEVYYTARERLTHAQDMRRRYTRSGNARKALSAEIEEVKLKRGIEQAERMLDTLNDAMRAEITANPRDARDIRKRYRARQAKYLRKLLPLPHAE